MGGGGRRKEEEKEEAEGVVTSHLLPIRHEIDLNNAFFYCFPCPRH